ncbi:Acidic proline-rich protein PRP25 precursor, putative, partial [Perkinsus marinus ATCC 50983]
MSLGPQGPAITALLDSIVVLVEAGLTASPGPLSAPVPQATRRPQPTTQQRQQQQQPRRQPPAPRRQPPRPAPQQQQRPPAPRRQQAPTIGNRRNPHVAAAKKAAAGGEKPVIIIRPSGPNPPAPLSKEEFSTKLRGYEVAPKQSRAPRVILFSPAVSKDVTTVALERQLKEENEGLIGQGATGPAVQNLHWRGPNL